MNAGINILNKRQRKDLDFLIEKDTVSHYNLYSSLDYKSL